MYQRMIASRNMRRSRDHNMLIAWISFVSMFAAYRHAALAASGEALTRSVSSAVVYVVTTFIIISWSHFHERKLLCKVAGILVGCGFAFRASLFFFALASPVLVAANSMIAVIFAVAAFMLISSLVEGKSR